jgi:hypothetical protein
MMEGIIGAENDGAFLKNKNMKMNEYSDFVILFCDSDEMFRCKLHQSTRLLIALGLKGFKFQIRVRILDRHT